MSKPLLAKIKTLENTIDDLQAKLKAFENLDANGFYPAQKEPYFILLARDPIAASLVEAWACLRMGMGTNAMPIFKNLINSAVNGWEPQPMHDPQIRAAYSIASKMEDFRIENSK